MIYLLDVSALLAFGLQSHSFHKRVASWALGSTSQLATCAITELGFVRILAQVAQYGITVAQAKELLAEIKSADDSRFVFLTDAHGVAQLPSWVKLPKQITDGHLIQLAKANSAVLATLDKGIPGAFF